MNETLPAQRRLLAPEPRNEAARLVVLGFPDEASAFSLRDLLSGLEEEGILELGDSVVVTRSENGKVRLHQSIPLVPLGTALGSLSGMLLGMLILTPLLGAVAGAAGGALSSRYADVGIDDTFIRSVGDTLTPGTSALLVLCRKTQPALILERLKPFAGRCKVLQADLALHNEAALRELLEGTSSLANRVHDGTEPSTSSAN